MLHSFERYPEDDVASTYGLPAIDPWGQDFPDFEYANPEKYPSFEEGSALICRGCNGLV